MLVGVLKAVQCMHLDQSSAVPHSRTVKGLMLQLGLGLGLGLGPGNGIFQVTNIFVLHVNGSCDVHGVPTTVLSSRLSIMECKLKCLH